MVQEITSLFFGEDGFTVYVVEQHFAVGRGREYFNSYKGTEHFISTDAKIKKRIYIILQWIQKNLPSIYDLVEIATKPSQVNIKDAIIALCTLFTLNEHQAAGPEVLDPIIIEERKISKKYLSQIITLHQKSVLCPSIIILLQDNNFARAKDLLTGCPNGINIKYIKNDGKHEHFKIINEGANTVEDFLEAYIMQCFSTCSKTKKNVLMNDGWALNKQIDKYNPIMFQVRAKILDDEKEEITDDVDEIVSSIDIASYSDPKDTTLAKSILCMSKLFHIYCHDYGGNDIYDALSLATELDNDILKAHVYRYSHFFQDLSREEKQSMLFEAEKIFRRYGINDHAIYCRNNALIHQLHTNKFSAKDFIEMQEEAVYNVPGMVGLSHIFNNTGVACLLKGDSERAIEFFSKGLERAKLDHRTIQRCALKTNYLIALAYAYETISEKELRLTMDLIKNGMQGRVPHLAAIYIMDIIIIAARQDENLAKELVNKYPVKQLVQIGLNVPTMSSGQLFLQLQFLETYYRNILPICDFSIPNQLSPVSGSRRDFIVSYGFNPMIFNIWI